MVMERAKINSIVNSFFKEMNPTYWNGENDNLTFKNTLWRCEMSEKISLLIEIKYDYSTGWKYRCSNENKKEVIDSKDCKTINSSIQLADTLELLMKQL